jgi:hypothetical protein
MALEISVLVRIHPLDLAEPSLSIPKPILIITNIYVRLLENILWLWDSAESIRLAHSTPLPIDKIANIYNVLVADIEDPGSVQLPLIKLPIDFKEIRVLIYRSHFTPALWLIV